MPALELNPTHKPIQNCYAALRQFEHLGVSHEGAVKSAFRSLSASTSLLRIGWGEGGRRPDAVPGESGARPMVRCRFARRSINPNLADAAIEEMLIQHLLTERLFRTVFNNADFSRRSIIAAEIEKVIDALAAW